MDDAWLVQIGARIRTARDELDLTQAQLGELVGLSASAIGNYERGDRAVLAKEGLKKVRLIAEMTDSDLRWIVFGESYQDPLDRLTAEVAAMRAQLGADRLAGTVKSGEPEHVRAPLAKGRGRGAGKKKPATGNGAS